MRSRFVQEAMRDGFSRDTERASGTARTGYGFSAARQSAQHVGDSRRLPYLPATGGGMMDDEGNFLFRVGYSAIGGPDVIG